MGGVLYNFTNIYVSMRVISNIFHDQLQKKYGNVHYNHENSYNNTGWSKVNCDFRNDKCILRYMSQLLS